MQLIQKLFGLIVWLKPQYSFFQVYYLQVTTTEGLHPFKLDWTKHTKLPYTTRQTHTRHWAEGNKNEPDQFILVNVP